ncbi:MAG TPA: Fic family protein [Myxococcales bacterium]|nr:Fic family protein [Myxococcales bacterium]
MGLHDPPRHEELPSFLRRFQEAYRPEKMTPLVRVIAAGASHHRLAWIHPFLDGNGRVMRLFTHAWLTRCQLGGHGIWMVSRGLARNAARCREVLRAADEPRRGDYDGRGALTDQGLATFCVFFLETALDQIRFMAKLLKLEDLHKRIAGYAALRTVAGELPAESGHLLVQALLQGEVPRGDAARILGLGERTARTVVSRLVAQGLLQAKSHRAPLRLAFPSKAAQYYFPDLYPPLDLAEG